MRKEYLLGVGMLEEVGVEGTTGEGVVGGEVTRGGPWKAVAGRTGKEMDGLEGIRADGGEKVDMVGRPADGRPLAEMVGEVRDDGLEVDVLSHTSKLTCVR